MDKGPHLVETILSRPELFHPRELERGEFLLRAGELERHIYLIESGAVRVFFVSEFEEHTIRFGYRGSILTSLKSFYTGEVSEYYIQAIRKTKLQVLEKEAFLDFVRADPERIIQYQAMLEGLVLQMMEREIDLLTYSPVERVRRVMARSPQLFQEIPAKYIASYLRMTPETLSRIRKS